MKMPLLNYTFSNINAPQTAVLIHGLFGDQNNLGIFTRALKEKFNILTLDLRNHGDSFHSVKCDFSALANDVKNLCDFLNLNNLIFIGHSLGGKVAMKFADLFPSLVDKLVVLDIAPVSYKALHQNIFNDLNKIAWLNSLGYFDARQRNLVKSALKKEKVLEDLPIITTNYSDSEINFFMKSFTGKAPLLFKFNYVFLELNYEILRSWQNVKIIAPTLFIKGENSDYIDLEKHLYTIKAQFDNFKITTIAQASHWLHAEKPNEVLTAINNFVEK